MNIYKIIHQAIHDHVEQIVLPLGTSSTDVYLTIRKVMRDNPDIFWFSHIWNYSEENRMLILHYTISKERSEEANRQIENVILHEFHIFDVRKLMLEEQVMYVYKWLALNCNYNIYSAYNQTIYSVFVYRNSVCTGFAKAAQYLFKLLGIESQLVFGKLKNSERLSRHCWLMVKIDGKWYNFDPTLAVAKTKEILISAGVTPIIGADGLNYNYFCVDSETIKESKEPQYGSKEYIEDEVDLPICSSHINYSKLQYLHVHLNEDGELGHILTNVGTTADVYTWNQKSAIQKVIKVFHQKIPQAVINHEFNIMQELVHLPNVLKVDRMTEDRRGIIMEQATPLSDLLSCHYYQLTLSKFCQFLMELIDGVQGCLNHGILYRDIHLNNIYRDDKGTYKIGDFGSCIWLSQNNDAAIGVGSKWYMAPETYKSQEYTESSAIYEIAMVAYFILNNLLPPLWQKYGKASLDHRIIGEDIPLPVQMQTSDNVTEQKIGEIILQALSYDSSARFGQSLQSFRNAIEDLNIISQEETILFKGDTVERLDISTKAMKTVSSKCDFKNLDETHRTFNFESTCLNSEILVSNGEVKDIFDVPQTEKKSRIKDFATTNIGTIDLTKTCLWATCRLSPSEKETYVPNPQNVSPKKSSFLKRLFGRKEKVREDNVYSSVFAPSEVKRKGHFVVQVYLHMQEETEKVISLAVESDKKSERRDYMPLLTRLKRNDNIGIELNIYGEKILYNARKQLVWQGSFTKCSFDYLVPNSLEVEELSCEVNVFVNGNIVGDMRFLTVIVDCQQSMLNTHVISRAFNKIFISYAHQDIEQVKHIALAYKAQGSDYFFDRDKLAAGDIYEEEIFRYIDNADLFILCWSANAARSEYVLKETKHALMRAYPQLSRQEAKLKIYPISIKPRATYPQNMINIYNFEEI